MYGTKKNAVAIVRKRDRGCFHAVWRGADGKQVERSTGFYEFGPALREAQRMEATARFWAEHADGTWQLYAGMNFSPKFCFESFTHARHLRFDQFRALLQEAGVQFVEPAKWRDKKRQKTRRGKRYRFEGRSLTLSELIDASGTNIRADTVAYRLGRGWDVQRALTTPPMSCAESGRLGANEVNQRKK